MRLHSQFLIMMKRRHSTVTHSRDFLSSHRRWLLLRDTYLGETEGTGECLPDHGELLLAAVVVLPQLRRRTGQIAGGSVLWRIFESH